MSGCHCCGRPPDTQPTEPRYCYYCRKNCVLIGHIVGDTRCKIAADAHYIGVRAVQLCPAHPRIAAPQIKDDVAVAAASQVLRRELESELRDHGAPEIDIAL